MTQSTIQSASPMHTGAITKQPLPLLIISALGIVFGDIGTSPLYTLRECLKAGGSLSPEAVLGILSLILWSILVVVTLKYVMFVMRADNSGEGGILALMALVSSSVSKNIRIPITMMGLAGAAMFYGDSMITPAISILSAVEGLNLIDARLTAWVLPITIAIIVGLFMVQRRGTEAIGKFFGPTMLVWFVIIAVMGINQIMKHPGILAAVSPLYAVSYVMHTPGIAFVVMASVFLALTGGEALFADMGHFGKYPIQRAWLIAVFPALILNYFGQGAMILAYPEAAKNPFFLMAPSWALVPLVLLATIATVIASQAVISGAFSMTKQAVQLGYLPRINIVYTSSKEIGQIYVPAINSMLFVAVLFLVMFFRTSDNLAAAYGIAVSSTMALTTIFMYFVSHHIWKWSALKSMAVTIPLLLVDGLFVAANLGKIAEGGWFPLAMGGVIFLMMTTWKRGRKIVYDHVKSNNMTLVDFIGNLFGPTSESSADSMRSPERTTAFMNRVEGTAVFMNRVEGMVPSSFLHNIKHNKVIHMTNLFMVIAIDKTPIVADAKKIAVTDLGHGCFTILATLGFKETPDVPWLLELVEKKMSEWKYDIMDTSFFITRQTIIATGQRGNMVLWREKMFSVMSRNASKAADYFHIPANRVVEIGSQINI
jgi:KUP system potassium uptake protein